MATDAMGNRSFTRGELVEDARQPGREGTIRSVDYEAEETFGEIKGRDLDGPIPAGHCVVQWHDGHVAPQELVPYSDLR